MPKTILAALCALLLSAITPAQLTPPPVFATSPIYDTFEFALVSSATGLSETSTPNPFLDYRFDATFTHQASGQVHYRPGFYAADGAGGDGGSVWRCRFVPDALGLWDVSVSFYTGAGANLAASTAGLTTLPPHGTSFVLDVVPVAPGATAFRLHGPLASSTTAPYWQHEDGTHFLRAGVNSPENFLAYRGFDWTRDYGGNTPPGSFFHQYSTGTGHATDWDPGDPDWTATAFPTAAGGTAAPLANAGKAIVGAVRYLAEQGMNSMFFLPCNIGGDGWDTHPFAQTLSGTDGLRNGNTSMNDELLRYDVGRLRQWALVIEHAQDLGVMIDLVLHEEENHAIEFLGDSGAVTTQRRLYVKQLIALFGHHPAIRWILCEENGPVGAGFGLGTSDEFTPAQLAALQSEIAMWSDPLQHVSVSVHTKENDIRIYGDIGAPAWLDSLSLQVSPTLARGQWQGKDYPTFVEDALGVYPTRVCSLDELGPPLNGAQASAGWREKQRVEYLWDVLLSRGNVAWYFGYHDISTGGGDLRVEDFRTRAGYFQDTRAAVQTMTLYSWWNGQDADSLLTSEATHPVSGEAEVWHVSGEAFVIYYPTLGAGFLPGDLDMSGESGIWKGQFWNADVEKTNPGALDGPQFAFDLALVGPVVSLDQVSAPIADPAKDHYLVLWK